MHESVVDPQPAPNSADLAAENRRRTALKLLGIAAVIAAAAVFSLCAGRYGLSIADILDALLHPNAGTAASNVVWHVRLPRILLALLAGGGLALSGAAFQVLFANPLAALVSTVSCGLRSTASQARISVGCLRGSRAVRHPA